MYAHTLLRDSKGYLWIGSDGLFRYDGINIKRYIHDPKNNNSLVNNVVKSIAEDKRGRIWIGTIKGLSCYEPDSDSFTNFENDAGDPKHPKAHLDNVVHLDADNTIWSGDVQGIKQVRPGPTSFCLL